MAITHSDSQLRIIITGSREWNDRELMQKAILSAVKDYYFKESSQHVSEDDLIGKSSQVIIVHGGARGADKLSGSIAQSLGMNAEVFSADWDTHGKKAGVIRNIEMITSEPKADYCLAFFSSTGKNIGTTHAYNYARKEKIRTMKVKEDNS